tara:strand:+ start:385 stop:945 length:561 start_codon:yes stop_codon:yes gene_type:complete
MVVRSLLKNILPLAAVGLGIAFLYNIINKPGAASDSAGALGQTLFSVGSGLGSVGGGIQDLLTGVGAGSAKLLDPLFSLKTLFYGGDSPSAIFQENADTASNTTITDPVVNTASDQPGVTPTSPAGSTVTHSSGGGGGSYTSSQTTTTASGTTGPGAGGFSQTTTSSSPSSSSYTSRASGRSTRYG